MRPDSGHMAARRPASTRLYLNRTLSGIWCSGGRQSPSGIGPKPQPTSSAPPRETVPRVVHDVQKARPGMPIHRCLDTVHLLDGLRGNGLLRRPLADYPAILHDVQPVTVLGCQIEIVEDAHNCTVPPLTTVFHSPIAEKKWPEGVTRTPRTGCRTASCRTLPAP